MTKYLILMIPHWNFLKLWTKVWFNTQVIPKDWLIRRYVTIHKAANNRNFDDLFWIFFRHITSCNLTHTSCSHISALMISSPWNETHHLLHMVFEANYVFLHSHGISSWCWNFYLLSRWKEHWWLSTCFASSTTFSIQHMTYIATTVIFTFALPFLLVIHYLNYITICSSIYENFFFFYFNSTYIKPIS